jgi:hypothetical protein
VSRPSDLNRQAQRSREKNLHATIARQRAAELMAPSEPAALEAYANLLRATHTLKEVVGKVALSNNRHGDLQVIRSTALEIIRHADRLIAEEQGE